ncbi:MAG: TonB-dependent receptor [Halioglobus sp.]|nr:TonB-dependent receptor [Halioglobus sp.]
MSVPVSRVLLCAALALSTTIVAAQQLEEVIVTAQKRSESLQDVAVSVQVISGEELAALNKTQIAQLTRLVPSLTYATGTSDAGQSIVVRGVGTQTFSRSVDQSVGTVIDGIAAGSVSGSLLDYSDVQRVEVLRGPQGMLFGKNASAGVLSITTRAPTVEPTAGFGIDYSEENQLQLNGYVSGSIVQDKLLGRVAAYRNTRDAILENNYPGGDDFNDRDEWGVRSKLQWLTTADLDVLVTYNHAERDHQCCIGPLDTVESGSIADRLGGERGSKADTVLDNDTSTGTTKLDLYSLQINYQMGDYLLTSISGYSEEDVFSAARGDLYTRTALPMNDSAGKYEQFTQEVRLTSPGDQRISYVTGLYYYNKKIDREFIRVIDLYGIGAAPLPDSGTITVLNDPRTTNESLAAFGQATWRVSDAVRLSLGARYNDDRLSIDQTVSFIPGTIAEAPPGTVNDDTDDQKWSWRVIGEMDVADDAMAYVTVARGYKGPGSNSLPSGPSSGDAIFVDPEIPTNYEIGLKSEWLDNRLRVNGAIYYTEFKDFQASTQVPDVFPPLFILENAGKLETEGVELDVSAMVLENLQLTANMAYTDATFTDWKDAPCYAGQTEAQGCKNNTVQNLSGADMPDSPDWRMNFGANYYMPLTGMPFDGFVRGNYFWQDDVMYDTTNNPLHQGESFGTLDVYLGVAARDGRYRAQVYVLNVFDEFYINNLSGQQEVGILAGHGVPFDATRRVGVSLSMDF